MSVILNETKVYPGWELPKNEMAIEEKALLISLRQKYLFLFAKIQAMSKILRLKLCKK